MDDHVLTCDTFIRHLNEGILHIFINIINSFFVYACIVFRTELHFSELYRSVNCTGPRTK